MRDRLKSVPHSFSTGRLSETLREPFLRQAEHCEAAGSHLYAEVCRRLADAPAVAAVAPDDRWDLPLRVLAALHFLALSEGIDPWQDPASILVERADWISQFVSTQGVQTNEVQRSWTLLPCFLELARRAGAETLDLIELGPSAGLNLVWDRYRYRYEGGDWGPGESPLQLTGFERRPVPPELLRSTPIVRRRVGVDLNPIDVTCDDGAQLLECFIWADQRARLERLDRAIDALRREPPTLVQDDIVSSLPALLADRRGDALTIVFETAALGYLSEDERQDVLAQLESAGAEAPLGFVSADSVPGEPKDGYGIDWLA